MAPPSLNPIVSSYDPEAFFDELVSAPGVVRPAFAALAEKLSELAPGELSGRQQAADRALMRMGITFQVYGEESKAEKVFPFDILPRVIGADDWDIVDRGLRQRITALNLFVQDVYGEKKIIKDNNAIVRQRQMRQLKVGLNGGAGVFAINMDPPCTATV